MVFWSRSPSTRIFPRVLLARLDTSDGDPLQSVTSSPHIQASCSLSTPLDHFEPPILDALRRCVKLSMTLRSHPLNFLSKDIAVNLMDQNFLGTYNNRPKHPPDLEAVLSRAGAAGVERILITGTSLEESRNALELAKRYGELSTL